MLTEIQLRNTIVTWFNAHVFDGTSEPNRTTTLKTPSLRRARDFIDRRVEMGAIFGYWTRVSEQDPMHFAPEWVWGLNTLQSEALRDAWVTSAMGWADAWFENAKQYAMIIAPSTFTPPPNPCNKCRAEVPAGHRICLACSNRLY